MYCLKKGEAMKASPLKVAWGENPTLNVEIDAQWTTVLGIDLRSNYVLAIP